MTKMKPKTKTDQKPGKDIELVPDAWPCFERYIKEIAKAGPQHRKPKPKPGRNPKKKTPVK